MDNRFFEKPVIKSPYEYPARHWELDEEGQPTKRIIKNRRSAKFITPIPKPKKRKKAVRTQQNLVFDEGKGLFSQAQQYDPTSIINQLRREVDKWRDMKNPKGLEKKEPAMNPPNPPKDSGERCNKGAKGAMREMGHYWDKRDINRTTVRN